MENKTNMHLDDVSCCYRCTIWIRSDVLRQIDAPFLSTPARVHKLTGVHLGGHLAIPLVTGVILSVCEVSGEHSREHPIAPFVP